MSRATGRVIRVDSKVCWVRVGDGELRKCPIRGRLFREADPAAMNPVAVGDRVEISPGESETEGRVEAVRPRQNQLSRPVSESGGRRVQVIAANVDYLAVVVAAARPPLRPGLIDRYLIVAARQEIRPIVVVNKVDLVDLEQLRSETAVYAGLGKQLVFTSATEGIGVEELRRLIAGNQTVFAGHSGVGKSTLMNALSPGLDLETRTVSRKSGRGVHTTSRITLFEMEEGGCLIDTPGIRAMGLWSVEPEDVEAFFEEIKAVASACRFRGCTHRHEPDCAVKEAVARGDVVSRRFESYQRIVESLREEKQKRGY